MLPKRFYLKKGDSILGQLDVALEEMFWLAGKFTPKLPFQEYAGLFERQNFIVDDTRLDEMDAIQQEIMDSGLYLVDEFNRKITYFILYIEDDSASLRYIEQEP